ncbi:MAG: hypothetical protein RL268_166 [Pseudomonadota bacterium]|jgi:uncharacterized protein with ATP-grasp and redox domains
MLNHNNPPADAAFALHIDELFSLLSDTLAGGEVSNDEQEAAIDGLMDEFRKAAKDADKERATEKKPHDDAAKAVQAKWKPVIEKADRGTQACKEALTPYRTAKQRAKDEAARKAREEAEAKERAAQEALQQSDDLEARFHAEQELEQAKKLATIANRIDRSATGLRTRHVHRIVNRKELLLHVIDRYPEDLADMLNEFVRRKVAAGLRKMPGVEITEQKEAA